MAVENLYIKNIKIENYKSLKDSEIELKAGLNVIIGKNGAGKSNLLEFVFSCAGAFPPASLRTVNTNFSITYEYIKHKIKQSFSYVIEKIKSPSSKINSLVNAYDLTVNKIDGGNEVVKNEKIKITNILLPANPLFNFREKLSDEFQILNNTNLISLVSFVIPQNLFWVSNPGKIVIDNKHDNSVEVGNYSDLSFFRNLQIVIEFSAIVGEFIIDLNNSSDAIREGISTYLSEYLDTTPINLILVKYTIISKIRFNPNINVYQAGEKIIIENLLIDFYIDGEWLPWSYLSDGTKRMFYLITESLSIGEGILLVEEPELGIHPHQLYKIMDFLKEQSRNKQIIISTHSPLVLDALDENELNRIIIAKYDNGTKFNHLSEAQIAKAKKYMNEVGELSYYWLHSDLEE